MFRDLFRAFADLFTARRSRIEITGLLITMAMLPVSELLVTRMFSHLILDGPERFEKDPQGIAVDASIFFFAFALSRALHHIVRLNRVRVFRRGFESSGEERPASREAWSWAAAFEMSTAMVALIQVGAFCLLFTWLDPIFGLINIGIAAAVLAVIAMIYRSQLTHQFAYLSEGNKPGSTAVSERVGRRIRDAEMGAVVASVAMAFALGAVLYRAVKGGIGGADAFVLFIGLRMMYSQIGNLSAAAMRFARANARLFVGQKGDGVIDPDDEFGDVGEDGEVVETLQPAKPSSHRSQLVSQMMLAGQRGELDQVETFAGRLSKGVLPMEQEVAAMHAAEAYAELAAPIDERTPLSLMWWARPFPGSAGNWLSPLILRRVGNRPVLFQTPATPPEDPHLVMIGSIAGSAHEHSIVVGTGALNSEVSLDAGATYVSVRGPRTAEAVRKAGGQVPDRYGDPTVLASRLVPVSRPTRTNGRLAFVRHVSHAKVNVHIPGKMDELNSMMARPDTIAEFITSMAGYDGVVTSDFHVTALCHSYGIPCAPIAFEGHGDLDFVFRDYADGLEIELAAPTVISPQLDRGRCRDLLREHRISDTKLDEIEAAITDGVNEYLRRVEPASV